MIFFGPNEEMELWNNNRKVLFDYYQYGLQYFFATAGH